MTEHCHACAEAVLRPETGIVFVNCEGCNVRSVSKMPGSAREAVYAAMPLVQRAEFSQLVAAEYRRRTELRKAIA